jgi:hypothetical protein
MHIIMPAAGRILWNTNSGGIFRTKRSKPDKVRRLTRIFVPNPKKAFQSPGTQIFGLSSVAADCNMVEPPGSEFVAAVPDWCWFI